MCPYDRPWAVTALFQGFITLSVQLCGDYVVTQRNAVSPSGHWPISSCSCRYLFCNCVLFFCTVERLFQGRHCGGPAEGCEGNWLFSYHSRHSTHICSSTGTCHLTQSSQGFWQVYRHRLMFPLCSPLSELLSIYVTHFNCKHSVVRQEGQIQVAYCVVIRKRI